MFRQVYPALVVRFIVVLTILMLANTFVPAQSPNTAAQTPIPLNYGKNDSTQFKGLSDFALDIYSNYISPVDGDQRCSFYPSCSQYARQAFDEHGSYLGTLLTFDRLIRCGFDHGPKVLVNGQIVIYDPVSNNTIRKSQ